ncbi:NIPSNAP family protein [Streptomyces sp. AF1B]|uniref:NIPSNAP family protein n=1 Tax=Streptomyces sp. AF1B TaxID=3399503 RepID=UPI003AACEFE8
MITCHLRYEIDPRQVSAFEEYVTGWIPIVNRLGGTHHGCFLPSEGANDIAYALFSFPSLAAYETYREAIRRDAQARKLWQLSERTGCIRRFDRTFLRPVIELPDAGESLTAEAGGVGTAPAS